MKIAYFGFDLFYDCIEEIYNCGNEIVKIFTCKVDGVFETNSKIYEFARKHNVEITDSKVTENDISELIDKGCDLLFSAGYYFKIPILSGMTGVNIHPALLPVGRGPWPQPLTILKGLSKTGVTLHVLAESFDSGEILHVREFSVDENDNLLSLNGKYLDCARKVTRDFLSCPTQYFERSVKQSDGEYWAEPNEQDMSFSLSDSYDRIDRVTRAFFGFGCFVYQGDVKKRILKAVCSHDKPVTEEYSDLFEIDGGWLSIIKYA